jgi:hypothetical protein
VDGANHEREGRLRPGTKPVSKRHPFGKSPAPGTAWNTAAEALQGRGGRWTSRNLCGLKIRARWDRTDFGADWAVAGWAEYSSGSLAAAAPLR